MTERLKTYETIGCCGIDCGLCPRFHTKGDSACPGCGGLNFSEKHPSCGFLTCCVIKNRLEVCAHCSDYPCQRFDSEREGYDSFVSHKKIFINLDDICNNGIEHFIENQKIRISILNDLLNNFDDGRSKSFYCLCCTLLPVEKLQTMIEFARNISQEVDLKVKIGLIKERLKKIAASLEIDLKLNRKTY